MKNSDIKTSLPVLSPCRGCAKHSSCTTPCAAVDALLEKSINTDYRSVPLFEERLRVPGNEDEVEEEGGPWARFVEEAGPQLPALTRKLPGRERFVLLSQLAGRSADEIAQALGIAPHSIGRIRGRALALLRRQLGDAFTRPTNRLQEEPADELSSPEKPAITDQQPNAAGGALEESPRTRHRIQCAVPYCCRLVELAPTPSLELNAFCQDHRHMKIKTNTPAPKRLDIKTLELPSSLADLKRAEKLCAPSKAFDARLVSITPGLAAALLRRGTWDGWLSSEQVAIYTSDMKAGAWQIGHHGIGIGRDGKLHDGRHQLWAVVQAEMTVPMLVVRGLDAISLKSVDSGRVRSVGETAFLLDSELHANKFVPWLKAIAVLHGQRPRGFSRHAMLEQIARFRPSLHWLLERAPKEPPYNRAAILGALVYAHSVVGRRIESFVRGYATGENLSSRDPALRLRVYVAQRMRHVPERDRAPHLKTLRCVRAFLEKEPIDRMPTSEHGYRYLRALESNVS